MHSCRIAIAILLLTTSLVSATQAYNRLVAHGSGIRQLVVCVEAYKIEEGTFPVSDAESTWYEKLVDAGLVPSGILKMTADGKYPLGYYGNPIVYEPPGPSNGNQVVIRDVGKNGVDNFGALDDWGSRFGPNTGYWYKKNWPSAYRRAWICAVLAMIGLVVIVIKIEQTMARFVFASLWFGLLAGVVLPVGFDSGWSRSSASIDPTWITPASIVGVLLIEISALILIIHGVRAALYRRSLRINGDRPCAKCHYDLRGTIAANIDRCPECGEPVQNDSTVEVDLTPPPSP
jgi:hypothetical protein